MFAGHAAAWPISHDQDGRAAKSLKTDVASVLQVPDSEAQRLCTAIDLYSVSFLCA